MIKCGTCMTEFISKEAFDQHVDNCTKSIKEKCMDCGMIFDTLQLLISHTKENHIVRLNIILNVITLIININYLTNLLKLFYIYLIFLKLHKRNLDVKQKVIIYNVVTRKGKIYVH